LKKVHSGVDHSKQALHQVRLFLWLLAAKIILFSVLREQIISNFFLPIWNSDISASCRRWRKSISVQFDGDLWPTTDKLDCDNMGDFDRIHFVHSLGSWFA
jgi:hypothetical protein